MAEWNALLAQPSAGNTSILSDPAKALGMVGQLNQIQLFNQLYKAREGVGEAYKGAVRDDGSVDEPALRRGAASAGFLAPETMTAVQTQEGQRIQNATAAFSLAGSQNRTILDAIGTLADKPNLGTSDVHNLVGALARNTNIPASILNGWASTAPKDPAKLREWLVTTRNMAMGAANTQGLVTAPPGTGGEPRTMSQGQANFEAAGVRPDAPPDPNAPLVPKAVPTSRVVPPTTGIATGLAPGESTALEASAKAMTNIQATAVTSPQIHANLDMLKRDSRILGKIGGPTVDWEKKANQIAARLKQDWGITMTPDQLAAAESFPKISEQMAAQQIAVMSDAGLHNAQAANPSLQMSQTGRENILDMLHGNQDVIDTWRKETNKAVKSGMKAGTYNQFASDLADNMDVRVFQFNRLSKEGKQKFINTMEPGEVPAFETNLRTAINKGWIKAPSKNAE